MPPFPLRYSIVLATILIVQPAWAAENEKASYHEAPSDDIVVSAPIARALGSALSGISVISGADLARALKPTIGETLSHTAGVSSTAFGPNASRPVLRGFQGERVRVLTDGIGSFDVSNTSVDHAVVINPLTASRIEVLRGPSALLFGSSAIGGVVNVIDSRIPRAVPDEALHLGAIAHYASAANERSIAVAADAPIGPQLVAHIDASYARASDLKTGGFLLTPALGNAAKASGDADIAALADLKGRLPNSAARSWDIAGGAAWIGDSASLGFSVARHDSLYGVPIRFSLDPATPAEEVRLDVRQTRYDARGEIETGGDVLGKIRFRAGYADYQHDEIDDQGAIGTTFTNTGFEGRLELVQADRGSWKGAVGAQAFARRINIIGDEKFLPRAKSQQYGLFTLQEFGIGPATVEIGARYEHAIQQADADATLGNGAIRRSFDAVSGSLGASLPIAEGWTIGLNASHSERAPSAEELFANGPHAGTQAFEVGDPGLTKERSFGLEATIHGRGKNHSLDVSIYRSWFRDYIYDGQTGRVIDGLPEFQNLQADARYTGIEIQGSARLATLAGMHFAADGLADYVRAHIVGSGPAPRIPPLRILGGLETQGELATLRLETEWTARQSRVSAFETPTGGYTLVNANLTIHPFPDGKATSLILSADNLFNATARRHASFLKDYAPLAGRDIRLTLKVSL